MSSWIEGHRIHQLLGSTAHLAWIRSNPTELAVINCLWILCPSIWDFMQNLSKGTEACSFSLHLKWPQNTGSWLKVQKRNETGNATSFSRNNMTSFSIIKKLRLYDFNRLENLKTFSEKFKRNMSWHFSVTCKDGRSEVPQTFLLDK